MFCKYKLDLDFNPFIELSNSIEFENIAKGRKGATLVDCKLIDNEVNLIPIVRTTTSYNNVARKFLLIHHQIVDSIKRAINNDIDNIDNIDNVQFNNAMIEIYDSTYRTMRYHTDQALDLANDSYICIFSCYTDSSNVDVRKLEIKNKVSGLCSEILLEHNSIVLFSVTENSKHVHRIVLDGVHMKDKKWLGITFRLSKTFIKFIDNLPYFYPSNVMLNLANDDEKQEFMKYKGRENLNCEYVYPDITYTISHSDLIPLK